MIEINDTSFGCNGCKSYKNVKYVSITLDGSTQRTNVRLCKECRKQLKAML